MNVSPAVTVPVSITGELIFGKAIDTTNPIDKDNDNVFQMMDDMIKAAEENDIDGLLNGLSGLTPPPTALTRSGLRLGHE